MGDFYTRLAKELKNSEKDIWVETVLSGVHAGEKRIFSGEENDVGDDAEGGQIMLMGQAGEEKERVFRERTGHTPKLIICGAGHVSVPIIRIGKMLGFFVTVLEDRPKFADNARTAGADEVMCLPFSKGLSRIKGDSDTWFVIVTRGHRYDTECLEAVLNKPCAYVGMMGSRRRTDLVKAQLEQKGFDRTVLNRVHTPIGLKIHAETPEEIAVSVMAEIIQIKNTGKRTEGYSEELLQELTREDGKEKVLAVIVSKKGSAPRGVGTKMLIREDGSCLGTVGGGCMESGIIQKALLMMRLGRPEFQICRVDMTAGEAEDAGMVCGGEAEVMLEKIGR